jgi:hypothetical protein
MSEATSAEAAATERAVTERATAGKAALTARMAHREARRGRRNVNMGRKAMLGHIGTARHMALREDAGRRMVRMIVEVVGSNAGQREITLAHNEAAIDRIVVVAWNTGVLALSGGRLRCRYGGADPAEQ